MRNEVMIDGKTYTRTTIEKAAQALAEPLPPAFKQGDFVRIIRSDGRYNKLAMILSPGASIAARAGGLIYPEQNGAAVVVLEGSEKGGVYCYREDGLLRA